MTLLVEDMVFSDEKAILNGILGRVSSESTALFGRSSFNSSNQEIRKYLLNELMDLRLERDNDLTFTEDQKTISTRSFLEAMKIINLIPIYFPKPSIVPEPEGSIGFEWYSDKGKVFVISLDGSETLIYAGINRKERTKGTIPLTDVFPDRLALEIRNLFM